MKTMTILVTLCTALALAACDAQGVITPKPGHSYLARDFYGRPFQVNIIDVSRDGGEVLVTVSHGAETLRTDTFWLDSHYLTITSEVVVSRDDRGTCNQG